MTAALGTITRQSSPGSITITKTGLGTLALGAMLPGNTVTLNLNNGNLSLLHDGDGTGSREVINSGITLVPSGPVNLTIGRLGTTYAPLFTTASNKTLQMAGFALNNGALMVTSNNGYGLELTGAVTLGSNQLISVTGASTSNVVPALTISGVVSGGSGITKIGNGTLALTNAGNSFTGLIDIQAGTVAASSDGAFGNLANGIQLGVNSATVSSLRITGSFATNRTITLTQANNAIDVTGGNTFTLNAPFSLSAANRPLFKLDNGTMELAANNTGWTGRLTVGGGAVKVSNANALGSTGGNTVVTGTGAALQLNGVTLSEPFQLTGTGINSGGALQALAGTTNTISGAITLSGSTTMIGADAGATLNLTGALSGAQPLIFGGAGNINKTGSAIGAVSSITKWGSGDFTLGVTSGSFVGGLTIDEGVFRMNSNVTIGGTGTITVRNTGTLAFLGGLDHVTDTRPLTLQGGKLLISGATGSTETMGALTTSRSQTNVIDFALGTGTNTLTFASLAIGGDSSINFTGTLNSSTNRIAFSSTPAMTNNVIQRALVNGVDFATYNGSGGTGNIQAFTAYNTAQGDIDSVGTTTNVTMAVTSTPRLFTGTANRTLNALKINGTGINVGNGITRQEARLALTTGAYFKCGRQQHNQCAFD
jgi:autotransporter-associated beta strand protein